MPVFQGWQNINFGGQTFTLEQNTARNSLSDYGFPNDALSSFKLSPNTRVTFYEDRDFSGRSWSTSTPGDYPTYTVFPNDTISSLRVEYVEPSEQEKLACYNGTGDQTRCGDYAQGMPKLNAFMRARCAANPSSVASSECQRWCAANPGECDSAMISYCATPTGAADPLCACINSKANAIINPLCADKACVTGGYATTNMRNTACPSIIDCSVKVQLDNSGVSLANNVQVAQNCGNTEPPVETPVTTATPVASSSPFLGLSMELFILIIVLISMLSAGIVYVLLSVDEPSQIEVI